MSLRFWVAAAEWIVAAAWMSRAASTLYHLDEIPDLLDSRYDGAPDARPGAFPASLAWADPELSKAELAPQLSVLVPALNEAASVGACLRSLLASQGIRLDILAINDRSTDRTGSIMEEIALEAAQQRGVHTLRVIHIATLPPGWLGKPHALAAGASLAHAPLLLFTDADALYAPDALARALRFVEQEQADHLVLLPTPILKSPGERMMLGMMQVLAIWPTRLWKIPDPEARDCIGVGCFNLLRRSAYEQIGGFDVLRMEVLEDLRLGYLVKHHGLRQRVAFGRNLLCLHWATGALGIVQGLTKNFFAIGRYRVPAMAAAICGTAGMTLGPAAGLFVGPARLPALLILIVLAYLYMRNSPRTGISPGHVLLFPVASCLFLYSMLRSTAVTLARGGVTWRGTFYPLTELRRDAGPLR